MSCDSGVIVGRLNGGDDNVVVLCDWTWLRLDDDLLDCPSDVIIVRPSVVMLIDGETFDRLAGK